MQIAGGLVKKEWLKGQKGYDVGQRRKVSLSTMGVSKMRKKVTGGHVSQFRVFDLSLIVVSSWQGLTRVGRTPQKGTLTGPRNAVVDRNTR